MLVYRAEFLERDSVHSSFFFSLCEKYKGLKDATTKTTTRTSKSNWLNRQNQASRYFCTFLCRNCKTTAGKCLISRFMVEVNKRRLNFLSLSELEHRSKS